MAGPSSSLRVLFTCREFSLRGGSQLYTQDVARRLRELGHRPVVFSPRLGDIAAETRSHGIPVIDDLDHLEEPPDIIHGQHHPVAAAAVLRFPRTPALYVCHGWLPWQEAPPRFPSIRKYIAVSSLCRERLVIEHGIPEVEVKTMYNFVDIERFRPRPLLPERPKRALLFSNQARADNFAREVEAACASFDITLDVIGLGTHRAVIDPENVLGHYDLVFGRGRSALEAMAVGAAVVLCDIEGTGPFVDTRSFDFLRERNFGVAAMRPGVDADRLRSEIARYDRDEAALVRDRVRKECGRDETVSRIVDLYQEVLNHPAPFDVSETLRAAARYLTWLGPFTESEICHEIDLGMRTQLAMQEAERLDQIDAVRTELRLANAARPPLEHSVARLEARVAQLDEHLMDLAEQLAQQNARVVAQEHNLADQKMRLDAQTLDLDTKARQLEDQASALTATRTAFEELQHSPFSRLRARLLRIGLLVRLYRFAMRLSP